MPKRDQKGKLKLSKTLLQMKFMKRIADDENTEDESPNTIIDDEHWVLDLPDMMEKSSPYIVADSMLSCDSLYNLGRMSFKGFNPEIERLNNKEEEEKEEQNDSEDVEFAESMTALSANLKKKFNKTRRKKDADNSDGEISDCISSPQVVKKKKKKKFLKPKD